MQYEEPVRRQTNRSSKSLQTGLTVSFSVPKNVHVPLVNAAVLSDYEAWLFVASLLANAVVGFLVAGVTNKDVSLMAITFVFSILFAIAIRMALSKRRLLRGMTKRFTLRSR